MHHIGDFQGEGVFVSSLKQLTINPKVRPLPAKLRS